MSSTDGGQVRPPSPWQVRAATAHDVPAIAEIIREVARFALPPSSPDELDRWLASAASAEALLARLGEAGVTQYVAIDAAGEVVGTAFVRVESEAGRPIAYLGGGMCRVRGQGAGRSLLERLLQHAESLGCTSAYMHMWSGNEAALSLARRNSFTVQSSYSNDAFFPGAEFFELARTLAPA